MFGPGDYTIPLDGAHSNDVQLQPDVEMKAIDECTEVISSSDAEQNIEYEIITLGELEISQLTNFQNILNDGYNDGRQDSISRRKMSIEELSPSSYKDQILSVKESDDKQFKNLENILPSYAYNDNLDSITRCKMSEEELSPSSSNTTNHAFKEYNEIKDSSLDHLIECVVDDTYEANKQLTKAEISLDDAFRECLIEIDRVLSVSDEDNFNNVLKHLTENGSLPETNPKSRTRLSDENAVDNKKKCSCIIHREHSYFNKAKNKRIVSGIEILESPNCCDEFDIGIHSNYFDESEIARLKRTCKRFIQPILCLNLPPTIDKCIECRVHQMKNNLTTRDRNNIPCRFYAFRQLRFTQTGRLVVAGYPDPYTRIQNIDLGMWLPGKNSSAPSDFNIEASRKILEDTGGQFCMLVKDEFEVLKLNLPSNGVQPKILWKKSVNGFREMCDVCKTTIFNHHWCCRKCGFGVCVDCIRAKLKDTQLTKLKDTQLTENQHTVQKNVFKKNWLLCSDQLEHQVENLSITQIMAGNSLNFISNLMHTTCHTNNIPLTCSCNDKLKPLNNLKSADPDPTYSIHNNSYASIFSDTDDTDDDIDNDIDDVDDVDDTDDNDDTEKKTPTLKALLNKKNIKYCNSIKSTEITEEVKKSEDKTRTYCRKKIVPAIEHNKKPKVWFTPKLSLLSHDKTEVPHMWLCEGYLLRLLDPKSDKNYKIFQEQWKRGQPVLVSDVGNNLSSSLWHPESFSRDFGDQINDLINCNTGDVISDQPMSKFWNGFENAEERLCDKQGDVMLLKLKDWPTSADFAESLPERFQDLMNCLPLKEYTNRNGLYNLASRLPECIVRPDLGPKMYIAYGNAGTTHKKVGTTNLHLDMSDAVNVMVYVAITKNSKEYDYEWHVREALQLIEEAGCDDLTMRRIYEHGEIPGALWHIYHASDANFIRDLLIKVSVEHGIPIEPFSDPIHDQSHYLDEYLRERLFREYGVKGYAIVQFYGDAVFIPAGAPHQVRNLHNCIKVAEDFVSPENVHHSFRMTQEFRNLTDSHNNHEDKLQIKNIMFHAVKDSISVLMHTK